MIPYLGCKQRFAKEFLAVIPQAKHFYDLFGGGGSVTEAASEVSQGFNGLFGKWQKWNYFHYNEINTGVCELNKAIWNGTFDFEHVKKQIPTKERYYEERTLPSAWGAFVSFVWSWGNKNESFIYPKKISVCRGSEHLERIARMEKSPIMPDVQLTNLDYREVEILPDSVVYCDIPYNLKKRCHKYHYDGKGGKFNFNKFYEWAKSRDFPVYFSDYDVPSGWNFTSIWEKVTVVKINANVTGGTALRKLEKLFWNGVTL